MLSQTEGILPMVDTKYHALKFISEPDGERSAAGLR
jgi:hypothetical protein